MCGKNNTKKYRIENQRLQKHLEVASIGNKFGERLVRDDWACPMQANNGVDEKKVSPCKLMKVAMIDMKVAMIDLARMVGLTKESSCR